MNSKHSSNQHIVMTANTSWCIYNFRLAVVRGLLAEGYRVTVLAPHDKFSPILQKLGCRFIDIKMDRHALSPAKDFLFMLRMKSALRKIRPDVVISYTIKNNIYGAIAARRLKIPFIAMVPGLGDAFASENWLKKLAIGLYRFAFKDVYKVLFLNDHNRDVFLEQSLIDPSKAIVMNGEGVDTNHFAFRPMPAKGKERIFLFCSRLLHDKGLTEFVAAAQLVRKANKNARFQILGKTAFSHPSGVQKVTLDKWASSGDVEYLGVTDDVRPFIEDTHCVVLPSYYNEGLPRILMEAASMGRAVITTDMPGCRDSVVSGKTGFICKPKNVESLVAAVQDLLFLSTDSLVTMGKQGRKLTVERFDERVKVDMYLNVLKRLFQHQ